MVGHYDRGIGQSPVFFNSLKQEFVDFEKEAYYILTKKDVFCGSAG